MPKLTKDAIVTPNASRKKVVDDRPLVTLSKGYTINIGDHQFVKVSAEASCFTNPTDEELNDISITLQKLDGILEEELKYHVDELISK